MPIAALTESLHPLGNTDPQTGVPSMGRPRIMVASYSVTVISTDERWIVWVYRRHQSTSAVNTAASIIDRPPVTSRASSRNPARCMNGAYRSSHVRGVVRVDPKRGQSLWNTTII
jgi:hypothetical protein